MSTTTKKYQIIQKLENGNTLVLHPETDADIVKVNVENYTATNLSDALTEIYEATEANNTNIAGCIKSTEKGAANGVASLDTNGRVPSSQLPSYVDDVIEGHYHDNKFYDETDQSVITGMSGKIYVDLDTNKTYRWSGSAFVVISETLALGTTSSTAYPGDKGKKLSEDVLQLGNDLGALGGDVSNLESGVTAAGKAKALDHDVDFCIDSDTLVGSNDQLSNLSGTEVHLNVELKTSGITAGTYSCVSVNMFGIATAGAQIIEVGTTGQTTPSSTLAIGGIFFKEI